MELFECKGLRARISPAQCRANRTRPVSSSLANLPTRPPACRSCDQWQEIDPPLPEVHDSAEQALAETLATLWNDIDEGRLGVKFILHAYNRRSPPEFRKRRSLQMGDWLQMLGFRVIDGERFQGVNGLRCLLMDGAVEAFVQARGAAFLRNPSDAAAVDRLLEVVGLESEPLGMADAFEGPESAEEADPAGAECPKATKPFPLPSRTSPEAAPCAQCRYFRPLPTFYGGVEGVRLCWADASAWDFHCFQERQEGAC